MASASTLVPRAPADTYRNRRPATRLPSTCAVETGEQAATAQRLENRFDPVFVAGLALREKQIQQSYRPAIGIHKWFARRPGSVFRSLLLAEYAGDEPLKDSYWRGHSYQGVVADPFMGGGTPLMEADRLGLHVVGADINPMAFWIVRQSLASLDLEAFARAADEVVADIENEVGEFYKTRCLTCGDTCRVKYFLWVKTAKCPACGVANDFFPGYLLAEAVRHPRYVLACSACGELNEYERLPTHKTPQPCTHCGLDVSVEGPAKRRQVPCIGCGSAVKFPARQAAGPPRHRMWAIEYDCAACEPHHQGRYFKRPDAADLERMARAEARLSRTPGLPIPTQAIPNGDETARLHRWGYTHFRDLFNDRQRLGLGLLLRRICDVAEPAIRHALLTVFSDFLRYQNMLCRYDTYALKCQDIFSVHGFPVGLVQCENNLLGIPGVGSGAFRHFVRKYQKAKEYCAQPFETRYDGGRKRTIPVPGERIVAAFRASVPPAGGAPQAWLVAGSATETDLPPGCLDGVFTDPPYFDNVQYAELMDFCYVWLRLGLKGEFAAFAAPLTGSPQELTGNQTLNRGLEHFAGGLSRAFTRYATALKPGRPFVFTFHHNDLGAYVPLVVALLDAGLACTAALPAVGEMSASLHIAGTGSSTLDTVFVCRAAAPPRDDRPILTRATADAGQMRVAGVQLKPGDFRCLVAGHITRQAVNELRASWNPCLPIAERMIAAGDCLRRIEAATRGSPAVQARLLEEQERYTAGQGATGARAV